MVRPFSFWFYSIPNTKALNLITSERVTPYPHLPAGYPTPQGGEERLRGPLLKTLNAFVLVLLFWPVSLGLRLYFFMVLRGNAGARGGVEDGKLILTTAILF